MRLELQQFGCSSGSAFITRSAADRAFELQSIQAIGGKVVRFTCSPSQVANAVQAVADCLTYGIQPLICLYGTTGVIAADSFGQTLASTLGDSCLHYEIANEPGNNGWTADGYADFVAATSDSIKLGNPNAKVIAGALAQGGGLGTATDPLHFVQSLFTRANGKFDAISIHLYNDALQRASWNLWDWMYEWGGPGWCDNGANGGTITKWLQDNGHSNIPIYVTECGGRIVANSYSLDKANVIAQSLFSVVKNKTQKVDCALWFEMFDTDGGGYGLQSAIAAISPADPAIIGELVIRTSLDNAGTNIKIVRQFTGGIGTLSTGFAYLDGAGAGIGSQSARFVVYADSSGAPGALLGSSDTVTVTDGQVAGWVTFNFSTPVTLTDESPIWIGVHLGGETNTIQLRRDSALSTARSGTDTFADGASNPFGTPSTPTNQCYSFKVQLDSPDPTAFQRDTYRTYKAQAALTASDLSTHADKQTLYDSAVLEGYGTEQAQQLKDRGN